MTRIVAISDTHNLHRRIDLPEGDILIHCGDVSGSGSQGEIESFIYWFASRSFKHKLFIGGNHDFYLEDHGVEGYALPDDVHYLQDSGIEVEGLKIWGSPWSSPFGDWAFQKGEAGREEAFSKIPGDTDILITHSPPAGRGDLTWMGDRIGCHLLLSHTQRVQPKLHLFGHCHYGYGVDVMGRWANCAVLGEDYKPCNPPVEIVL